MLAVAATTADPNPHGSYYRKSSYPYVKKTVHTSVPSKPLHSNPVHDHFKPATHNNPHKPVTHFADDHHNNAHVGVQHGNTHVINTPDVHYKPGYEPNHHDIKQTSVHGIHDKHQPEIHHAAGHHGNTHAVNHHEPAVHHNKPAVHHNNPAVHHNNPAVHHNEPALHHNEPAVHHNKPAVHHNKPVVHHTEPAYHKPEPHHSTFSRPVFQNKPKVHTPTVVKKIVSRPVYKSYRGVVRKPYQSYGRRTYG